MKHFHEFRQSDLNTFFKCPEQLRLKRAGLLPRVESDATALGTAMHAGIEAVLKGECAPEEGLDVALDEWERLAPTVDRWLQMKNASTVARHVSNCYVAWLRNVYPRLGTPLGMEVDFRFLAHEDDEREVWFVGTIDYLEEWGVWDWKTAARAYEEWEVRRFKIQPTMYAMAARELYPEHFGDNVNFAYGISLKGGKPKAQVVETTRDTRHWSWLVRQCLSLAHLYEAGLPVWPLQDQGWWCSEKWCPAWLDCKGAHVDAPPPMPT